MAMDQGPDAVAETIADIPQLDDLHVAALEAEGITTLKELSQTTPADIRRITGLSGMDAIIVKEKATRSVEAGVEGSMSGKLTAVASKFSPALKDRFKMNAASLIRRTLNGR